MDFIYYRPITGIGPPVIRDGSGYYRHLLDFNDVLKSKNNLEVDNP